MFYRRKLPHWHPDKDEASFLFVAWRLSGSIPQVRLPQRLAGESACPTSRAAGLAFLASDREADKAAFGPVWLRDPADWPWSSARLAGESACPTIAANLGQM